MFDEVLNLNVTSYMIAFEHENLSLSQFDNYINVKLGCLNYIIMLDVLSCQITWHIIQILNTIGNNLLKFFNWSHVCFNLL